MRMPDVNILIYAHRSDEAHHEFYRHWLENLVNGPEPFALSELVAVAFLRIVTHPGFPPAPTPLPQAFAVIESLRARPGCKWLRAGERHWEILQRLVQNTGAKGKIIADAQHSAIAMEHGCTWVTRDRDFKAFASNGLRLEILKP